MQYATEVQSNILSSSKQLAQARGSLNAHVKNQKVSALTLKELESMGGETRVYRSIGKM